MAEPLSRGSDAPDFSLPIAPDRKMSLCDLGGHPAVLVFYPADWSPVCSDQMSFYNEIKDEFDRYGAELVGISVDDVWCHQAFRRDRRLRFPLLADFEPKGHVSRQFGVYRERDGFCERALFVIDARGTIAWSYVSPIDLNPGAEGILEALEDLERRPSSSQRGGEHAHPAG